MNFFKHNDLNIYSPLQGQVISLNQVKDEMFSQAMMGPGIAIMPENGRVFAPFDGQVKFVFPTKHAIGLVSSSGVELLIHMGIDTVQLEGQHFTVLIKDKQKIKKGQEIARFDLEALVLKQIDPTVILVLTDSVGLTLEYCETVHVETGDLLIKVTR